MQHRDDLLAPRHGFYIRGSRFSSIDATRLRNNMAVPAKLATYW
jgi:hypothetical protein